MKTRSLMRAVITPAAIGLLSVGVAWAGAGLAPVTAPQAETPETTAEARRRGPVAEVPLVTATDLPDRVALPTEALSGGRYWVGTAKVDLRPRPEAYGGVWETDHAACATLSAEGVQHVGEHPDEHDHLVTGTTSPWPENPDCLYMGGFGIGPMNPITSWPTPEQAALPADDPNFNPGLFVRTVAIATGVPGEASILTVIDAEGWLYDYANKCDDCGWKQIHGRLADELGVPASSFVSHATHSHAAMDFLGGWGFVPDWYMTQATEAIETSIRGAVASMRPARLEVGEMLARDHNGERRDTYRAPEDDTLTYLRAVAPSPVKGEGKGREVLATITVYAAHPTSHGTNDGQAHPDWPGELAAALERRDGGIAMNMMSGLGNMSARGGRTLGSTVAPRIPGVGQGTTLTETSIATTETIWSQPATNVPLSALGLPGFFDRRFLPTPASISVGESDASPCVSASPFSVEIVARAHNIGGLIAVTSGPGEMFSNSTNTIEEHVDRAGAFALAVAQANDSLGYLPESFELSANPAAQQGGGFGAGGSLYINYEDSYAIDRCFGDANLEYTLDLVAALFG